MSKYSVPCYLSIIITILAAISSAGGLLLGTIYNDNEFIKSAWYSNDIITLVVVVPLLSRAIGLSKKGSRRWLMVWIGLLGYMFYCYAFYLFGAAFNVFFLLYATLCSLSAFTFVLLLSVPGTSNIASGFAQRAPVKWVSIYLLFIAAMLFIAEISMIIPFLTSGTIPRTIQLTAHPTSVVFALDFTIVIPVSITGAVLLLKRSSSGFVMSIAMLVKGFTYGLVLCLGTIRLAHSDAYGKWDPLMPFYFLIAGGGLTGCWFLLRDPKDI